MSTSVNTTQAQEKSPYVPSPMQSENIKMPNVSTLCFVVFLKLE